MLRLTLSLFALTGLLACQTLACQTASTPHTSPAMKATPAQGEATTDLSPVQEDGKPAPPIAEIPRTQPPQIAPPKVQVPKTPQVPPKKVQACTDKSPAMDINTFISQQDSLIGKKIRIIGLLRQQAQMCTEAYCGEENPCCNTCGTSYSFFGLNNLNLEGKEDPNLFHCSGDSCGVTCGIDIPPKDTILTGTLQRANHGYLVVKDADVCLPCACQTAASSRPHIKSSKKSVCMGNQAAQPHRLGYPSFCLS